MSIRALYFTLVILIFITEVAIALGLGGPFVRGSVGDILVIGLVYYFLRGIGRYATRPTLIQALVIGYVVEGLQAIHLADLLGLQRGGVLYTVIGNTFTVSDLMMYTIGGILAYGIDIAVLIPRQATKPQTP